MRLLIRAALLSVALFVSILAMLPAAAQEMALEQM
jgi:hypothetical protein